MKYLIPAIGLFGGQAFADAANYQQAVDLYAQATLPAVTDVDGWWSGRCFSPAAPNTATGSLLIATTIPSATNLAIISPDGGDANRYDTLTSEDTVSVNEIISGDVFQEMIAHTNNGASVSRAVLDEHSIAAVDYFVKKAGNQLAGEIGMVDAHGAITVAFACSFSKKVHP